MPILNSSNNLISVLGSPPTGLVTVPIVVGTIGVNNAVLDTSWLVLTPYGEKLVGDLNSDDSFLVFLPSLSQPVNTRLGSSGVNTTMVSAMVTDRGSFYQLGSSIPLGSLVAVFDPATRQACRCLGTQIPAVVQ